MIHHVTRAALALMRGSSALAASLATAALLLSANAGAQERHASPWHIHVLGGFGYASFTENRPDGHYATNPLKLETSGLALQFQGGVARRLSTRFSLGAALSYFNLVAPSYTLTPRSGGTLESNESSLGGGYVGALACYELSDAFDVNAILGFGGLGRSSPSPGMGGTGPAFSAATSWHVSPPGAAAVTLQARFTVISMNRDGSDGEGTNTSTLIMPALLAGVTWR